MSTDTFAALVLEQRDGATRSEVRQLPASALPDGDVLVRVAYSDLNYKDGLAITGRGRIVRAYPMVPGIDFAGTVEESASPDFAPGDAVILTGWGVGERHWGGFAGMARVKADWLVKLPDGLNPRAAMAFGTAGFTAMLCVMALEDAGIAPDEREVVVTGADARGMRLTDRLPYFTSGVHYPDWIVLGPETLEHGLAGVRAAGFFGPDWRIDTGESARRE